MTASFETAAALLAEFKGETFVSGFGVLPQAGALAARLGRRAVLIRETFPGSDAYVDSISRSLASAGVEVVRIVMGAAPNAPLEDLRRITAELVEAAPDCIVSFGGGSTIDCAKAAEVLRTLGGTIEDYFGTGLVTAKLAAASAKLTPHLAIQTAASSAAHLTKYSNITDMAAGQKKLIVDEAIVPHLSLFDYSVTRNAPQSLTADGALDGLSHCLEVYYGATGKPNFELVEKVALEGIRLVAEYLPRVVQDPHDAEARTALGYATDLGGYSIMLGGTNGAHLTSFSLVDILSHGRACALMNPYYTVFYSPAVQPQLERVLDLLPQSERPKPAGRPMAEAVARGIIQLEQSVGNPCRLNDVPGFTDAHIGRALRAAKNPQLRMKLENMPVPLSPEQVDGYMGPVLEAGASGDLSRIRTLEA